MHRNRSFAKKSASGIAPSVSCAWVKAHSFPYLDGELDPVQALALETHTASCSACRHDRASSRRSEQALASALANVPPAGDLRPGFYARLAEKRPVPRRPWSWQIAVPALALGMGLLALIARPHQLSPSAVSSGPLAQAKQQPERIVAGEAPTTETPQRRLQEPRATRTSLPTGGMSLTGAGRFAISGESETGRLFRADVGVSLVRRRRIASAHTYRPGPQVALARNLRPTQSTLTVERQAVSVKAMATATLAEVSHSKSLALVTRSEPQPATYSSAEETVLTVEDDVRGFKSSARIASEQGSSEGEAVISIDAEDTPTSNSASKPQ